MTFYQIIRAVWNGVHTYSTEEQGKFYNALFNWAYNGVKAEKEDIGVENELYSLYLLLTELIIPKVTRK